MKIQLLFTYTGSNCPTFTVERRDSTINRRNMDNWQLLEERGFFFSLRYVWLLVEYPLHGLNDKCSQQAQIAEYLITWWCYLWRLWDFGEKWPCRREYSIKCWHWEFIALSSFLPLFLLPICGWRCNVSAAFSSGLLPDLPNNYSLFYWNNKSK